MYIQWLIVSYFLLDDLVSGVFTMNVVAAAPVVYCKKVLETSNTVNEPSYLLIWINQSIL